MQENNLIHQAFPGSDIDDSVRQDVLNQAVALRSRHQHRKRIRRALVGSIATIAIVAGVAVAGPSAFAHYRIQRIAGSMDDCQSAILTSFIIGQDGSSKLDHTIFYSKEKWRIERNRSIQVYSNPNLWVFQPSLNQVTKQHEPDGPFAYNSSGFSIRAMLADESRFQWHNKTTVSSGTLDGKPAEILIIEEHNFPSRSVIYADPKTHMPIEMTQESVKGGKWVVDGYSTFKINSKIDPTLFEPNFPSTAKVIDLNQLRDRWAKQLEKPLGEIISKTSKIVIRDISVNSRGHLFIVFTDGETVANRDAYARSMRENRLQRHYHRNPDWHVKTASGTEYFRADQFQPYINRVNHHGLESISLKDGQVLQGTWLVPTKVNLFRSEAFTLSCTMPWTEEVSTAWETRILKPDCKMIPEWMLVCATGPRNSEDVLKAEKNLPQIAEMMPTAPKGSPNRNAKSHGSQ